MLKLLIEHEILRLRRFPVRLLGLLLYAGLVIWAAVVGARSQQAMQAVAAQQQTEFTARAEWMAELERVEAEGEKSASAARPMNLKILAVVPPGPLTQLSHRFEAIHPRMAEISGWRSEASLFQRYQIDGPSLLARGAFDLGYIVLVVMPLVLLLLSFDALSSERESGRFRMLLVQGVRTELLLCTRVAVVACPLWLISVAGALLALGLAPPPDGSGLRIVLWLVTLTTYTLFWAVICVWVACLRVRVVDSALLALATWVTAVVLLPSLVQFAAETQSPTPSRLAYHQRAREGEARARRELDQRTRAYLADHHVDAERPAATVPEFYRAAYLANIAVNEGTAPQVAAFDRQLAAQVESVERAKFLSPVTLTQRNFDIAAGAGAERAAEFRRQARQHLRKLHLAIGPATVGQTRLRSDEARAIPEFSFVEPEVPTRAWLAPFWTLLLAVAAGVGAWYATSGLRLRLR